MAGKKGYKRVKRAVKKKLTATRYEDGSVGIRGPRGPRTVPNVGEGGARRGGHGTVRAFGPSGVRDPFRSSGSATRSRTARNTTGAEGGRPVKRKTTKRKGK